MPAIATSSRGSDATTGLGKSRCFDPRPSLAFGRMFGLENSETVFEWEHGNLRGF